MCGKRLIITTIIQQAIFTKLHTMKAMPNTPSTRCSAAVTKPTTRLRAVRTRRARPWSTSTVARTLFAGCSRAAMLRQLSVWWIPSKAVVWTSFSVAATVKSQQPTSARAVPTWWFWAVPWLTSSVAVTRLVTSPARCTRKLLTAAVVLRISVSSSAAVMKLR